jgi:hypothetical protein
VLLYSGLDHQLNLIIIEVTHLAQSPMLEAVVATLDPRQKIEILKARAEHVRQPDWKKALKTHADRLERVAKVRNTACHVPLIPNKATGELEFAAAAASKLLKGMKIKASDDYTVDRPSLQRVKEVIEIGGKALAGGEDILMNFAKARAAIEARATSSPSKLTPKP